MTKAEAEKEFREIHLPIVIKQYGPNDKPARAEAWNNFTDQLLKSGHITRHQYDTWQHPRLAFPSVQH